MTNLLLDPLQRTMGLGRRAAATATRLSAPLVGPLAAPLVTAASRARVACGHAPALARGAVDQLGGRLPHVVTEQLPARPGEVEALEARVARLEAAAAAPAPAPRAKAAPRAPRTTTRAR